VTILIVGVSGQNADWRDEHGQGSPLGQVLGVAKKIDQGWDGDDATTNTN